MPCIVIHTLAYFAACWIVVCVLEFNCSFYARSYYPSSSCTCVCDGKCYTWAMPCKHNREIWVSCYSAYNVHFDTIELKYFGNIAETRFPLFGIHLLSLTNRTTEPLSGSDLCSIQRTIAPSQFSNHNVQSDRHMFILLKIGFSLLKSFGSVHFTCM